MSEQMFTNEQIRSAILRAADRIERDPSSYSFGACLTAGDCGTPLCMIGWIAHEIGFTKTIVVSQFMELMRTGVDPGVNWTGRYADELYRMIDARDAGGASVGKCVAGMRAYADKFYPAESKAVNTYISQPLVAWSECAWRPSVVSAPVREEGGV